MAFKVGSKVRSKTSGASGTVTEIIKINKGHQIEPPLAGTEHPDGVYEERTDLRVEYTSPDGRTGEVLIHEADAESA
jgi:hypothetical protein